MKELYKQARTNTGFDATIIAPLEDCINIADEIIRDHRETQDATSKTTPEGITTTDYLPQIQALTGVGVPDTVKAEQAYAK